MFLSKEEKLLAEEYNENGYIIRSVSNKDALLWIRSRFLDFSSKYLKKNIKNSHELWLNQIHKHVSNNKINDFRLNMIEGINNEKEFRKNYFLLARPYLESLVGNELAMQLRINLSIQLPLDESSLLPVHADTWSGDSPFEVVVWVPLVDCYGTKTMYILPPEKNEKMKKKFSLKAGKSSETLFKNIENDIKWLEVKFGEVLIFDQGLAHGNVINSEKETRWSLNCRFKGLFTPYGDKKIGEFFAPITLRAASINGMKYNYPEI